MARSAVSICNRALGRVGHTDFIADLANDLTPEAEACRKIYDDALDELLEAARWPFATRTALLAAIDPTTLDLGRIPTGWTYAFSLPADLVSQQSIWSGVRNPRTDSKVNFAVIYDGRLDALVLLSDEVTPELAYTARVTNVTLFPSKFTDAFVLRLAADLALALPKNPALARDLKQSYEVALGEAWSQEFSSVQPDVDPDPDWIANR